MKRRNILLTIYFLAISFAFSACNKSTIENGQTQLQIVSTSNGKLSIREIDFRNYSYFDKTGKNIFTLKNGKQPFEQVKDIAFSLKSIEYVDLTNDQDEEALIHISIEYGAGSSGLLFVFTLENQEPKMLWYIESGYGKKGGLKNAYSENKDLIIELFGNNEFVESSDNFRFYERKNYSKNQSIFTKFRFRWNDEKFTPQKKIREN